MNLIPMETFEAFQMMRIAYAGFVWEKDGSVYSVLSRTYTEERDSPPFPFDKMPVTRGTVFYETKTEYIVSLLELKEDLVFDEKGAFIEKKGVSILLQPIPIVSLSGSQHPPEQKIYRLLKHR